MCFVHLRCVATSQIEVWDHSKVGLDYKIGSTTIDLEDRWFSKKWHLAGKPDDEPDDDNPKSLRKYRPKPVERRPLYNTRYKNPQGAIECWVDMLNPVESRRFPLIDISPPPREPFEVRVVVWRTKQVPASDGFTGMNDLFCKVWLEGMKAQQTDCHYRYTLCPSPTLFCTWSYVWCVCRCKHGKGSFNWRMKVLCAVGCVLSVVNPTHTLFILSLK